MVIPSRRKPVDVSLFAPRVVMALRTGPLVLPRVVKKIPEPVVAVMVSLKSKTRCQLSEFVQPEGAQVSDQVTQASNVALVRPFRQSVGSSTYCLPVSLAGATPPARVSSPPLCTAPVPIT